MAAGAAAAPFTFGLSAIAASVVHIFMAASAKRAAQAKNENHAVAMAVPGWDADVASTVANYNQGKFTLNDVQRILGVPQGNDPNVPSVQGVLWTNYWNEVGPQVQPDRNGCHSGDDTQPSNKSWCGGKTYGAGCCVAYDNLKNSSLYALRAAAQAEAQPGRAVTSQQFPTIYASKYGGINRPGYSVTFQKPASSLLGL
jgi:hypothetical protein